MPRLGRVFLWIPLLAFVAVLVAPALASAQIQLSTSQSVFQPFEPIEVHYSGLPGNDQDWLTLVPAGTSNEEWGDWFYTQGRTSGSYSFNGVDAGQYEVRAYLDYPAGGYNVVATLPITVGDAQGSTPGGPGMGDGRIIPAVKDTSSLGATGGPGGGRIIPAVKDTSGLPDGSGVPVSPGGGEIMPGPGGGRIIPAVKDTSNLPDAGGGSMGPGPGSGPGPGGANSGMAVELNLPPLQGLSPDQVVSTFYDFILATGPTMTEDSAQMAAPQVIDHFFEPLSAADYDSKVYELATLLYIASGAEGSVELMGVNYAVTAMDGSTATVNMTGTARLIELGGHVDDDTINDTITLVMADGVWKIQEIASY